MGLALAQGAFAQDRFADEILVTAERQRPSSLGAPAPVASALGLSALETPASLDVVDLRLLDQRGARTLAEATRGVTGLTFTTRSGAPGVFQSRGFTENALVTLYDGLRVQSATITARAINPFNYERIEVLRGPSSLVYGEGATAGAVNYVRRKPRLGGLAVDAIAEGGEQDRAHLGLALAGGLTDQVGFSLSGSWQRLGSFVEGVRSDTFQIVGSVGGRIGERTGFLVEADHFRGRVDDAYFGAPLVAGAIDASVFRRGYNRSPNNRMADDVTWARGLVTHQFSDALDYRGHLYFYRADRDWRNFYAFQFIAGPPRQVEARNVESLGYDHRLWGTRHELKLVAALGAVESRTVLALDHTDTDFSSPRRDGPPSDGTPRPRFALDAPQPAPFVQGPRLRQREADVRQTAVSAEQRLALGQVALVGGVRASFVDATLARPESNPPVAPFDARFRPVDWRAALTWQPDARSTLYATVTSGVQPVESLLLLPIAQANFTLSRSRGYEAGFKGDYGPVAVTAAAFALEQDRLPSVNPTNPNLPPQVGRQVAKGLEAAIRYEGAALSAGINAAYTDAVFRQFNDFGAFRDGVRPANVPEWVVNADIVARPVERVSAGAFVQHVSSRPSNNTNALFLPAYTTLDLFAAVEVAPGLSTTARVANVTDTRYVEWATQSFGQNNLYFGSPRRFELALRFTR